MPSTHRGILFDDNLPVIPKGMRGFFIANPGTGKTIFLNWLAYMAALAGKSVLILDGDSPAFQLERNLHRYGLHYGKKWTDLPITIWTLGDFNWNNIDIEAVSALNPDFVILESVQSMTENANDPKSGTLVKKALNKIHNNTRWCLISAHTNQDSFHLTRSQLEELSVTNLARIVNGHTSIISQPCDVAYLVKQLTGEPLRLAVIIKARRIPLKVSTYYYELKEPDGWEGYDTPMWWEPIAPYRQELSNNALDVLKLVKEHRNKDDEPAPISAKEIMNTAVTIESNERRGIINLLVERGDINDVGSFSYRPRD